MSWLGGGRRSFVESLRGGVWAGEEFGDGVDDLIVAGDFRVVVYFRERLIHGWSCDGW